jgi:hypothetical protein
MTKIATVRAEGLTTPLLKTFQFDGKWQANYGGTSGQGETEAEAIEDARNKFNRQMEDEKQAEAAQPALQAAGEAALKRIFKNAEERPSGGTRVLAHFLLSIYNGQRFPFPLGDFGALDRNNFRDCMAVLQAFFPGIQKQEIHEYFEDGGNRFEALAERYEIKVQAAGEL